MGKQKPPSSRRRVRSGADPEEAADRCSTSSCSVSMGSAAGGEEDDDDEEDEESHQVILQLGLLTKTLFLDLL